MAVLTRLLGESAPIAAVREQATRLLRTASPGRRLPPILILGETGTGKGLLAYALHGAGGRAGGPFVDVNCAAIPETLLEAELFGFERGAFTDARQAKAGLFQAAGGGTIFLDEVGLLPLPLQAKLLKVIEERSVRRLGSTRSEPIDVCIIAATSEDLAAATQEGRFRPDLYHRLAVVTLLLPPLRARGHDVLVLAEEFLGRVCEDYGLGARVARQRARAGQRAGAGGPALGRAGADRGRAGTAGGDQRRGRGQHAAPHRRARRRGGRRAARAPRRPRGDGVELHPGGGTAR